MTYEIPPTLPTLLDRTDNPYMPRYLQNAALDHDPDDFSVPHSLPQFPSTNTGPIDGGHMSAMSTADPLHDDTDVYLDDIDDNSSDSLDSIEDDEFPSFFAQRGSPPRLFHSHGTYNLPVDSDEMKVCITSFCVVSPWGYSTSKPKKISRHLEAGGATYPASHVPWKQL
jgi:hypothetical protein